MKERHIYLIADLFVEKNEIKEIINGIEEILSFWPVKKSPKPVVKNIRESFLLSKRTEKNLEILLKESLDDPWGPKINGYYALINLPKALENADPPSFSFLVTSYEMHNGKNDDESCLGLTLPLVGAILSVSKLREIEKHKFEILNVLTRHLTGHILDLFSLSFDKDPAQAHCQNSCVMQPYDKMENLVNIIKDGKIFTLCPDCQAKLAQNFIT